MDRYKLIVFDMDETLLKGRTIHVVAQKKGFLDKVLELENSTIVSYRKNKAIAKLLAGISKQEYLQIFHLIPLQDHLKEVLQQIKTKQIKTAIVTNSYQFLADDLRKRLDMDYAVGNVLEIRKGIITGELHIQNTNPVKRFDGCRQHPICKQSVIDLLCTQSHIDPQQVIAVGDGKIDICMLEKAGLGVAFNASSEVQQHADISTNDLRTILTYI